MAVVVVKSARDVTKRCEQLLLLCLAGTSGGTSIFLFVRWWGLRWRLWAMAGAPQL